MSLLIRDRNRHTSDFPRRAKTACRMLTMKGHFPLSHGVPRVDDRRVISGIVYVIRNGMQRKGYELNSWQFVFRLPIISTLTVYCLRAQIFRTRPYKGKGLFVIQSDTIGAQQSKGELSVRL